MSRTDLRDPAFRRGAAAVVPAERFVQAVAGAVLTQEQLRGGDLGVVGEPAGLQPVECEGPEQGGVVEVVGLRLMPATRGGGSPPDRP